MAGALTKFGIAAALFIMFTTVIIFTMSQLGSQYSTSIEQQFDLSNYESEFNTANSRYQNLSEQASLNQQTQDLAQLQGKLSAEESKINYLTVIIMAKNDLQKIYPIHPAIWAGLLSIITIVGLSASFYIFMKVVP